MDGQLNIESLVDRFHELKGDSRNEEILINSFTIFTV